MSFENSLSSGNCAKEKLKETNPVKNVQAKKSKDFIEKIYFQKCMVKQKKNEILRYRFLKHFFP